MSNNWDELAAKEGLETEAGYKVVFMNHKHFDRNSPMMLNHFKDGEKYVTVEEALSAIRLAEQALKKKYNIK